MISKVIAGILIALMIGAVVVGAVTLARGPDAERGGGQGNGRGRDVALSANLGSAGQRRGAGQGQGRGGDAETAEPRAGGQGQGRGGGQVASKGSESAQGQGQGYRSGQDRERTGGQAVPDTWETVEGTVAQAEELVLDLGNGQTLQVGLGPSHYRESQGFTLQVGDRVRVSGYEEDGEFKAGVVEKVDTGERIVLRDATGRPLWAGQGRGRNRV